jgi:hypothetical protein
MGFILVAESVVSSYCRDVCSYVENGVRYKSSTHSRAVDYGTDWDRLIADTPKDAHNEVWVDGAFAEVVGYYMTATAPGSKVFERDCIVAGLPRRVL